MSIQAKAYAKINWCLNINRLRDDGYHELDMLMQQISLYDELSFDYAKRIDLIVDGKRAKQIEKNLVYKAAKALNDYMGTDNGAIITLRKNIPSRAGLGGGSSNCAVALKCLNKLWKFNLSNDTLREIGAKLGSDVPYFIDGGLARITGTGDIITPLNNAHEAKLLIKFVGAGLSTGDVFTYWDKLGSHKLSCDVNEIAGYLAAEDYISYGLHAANTLEEAAIPLLPEIEDTINKLNALGADAVRMSGSGSTVFAVFTNEEQLNSALDKIPGSVSVTTLI